jgi:hypothetical protein
VLEERVLIGLTNNPTIVREFPFITALKPLIRRAGCGRCGNNNRQKATSVQPVKQAIANLSPDRKLRLKTILNVEKVKMYYIRPVDQRTIELEF